jgi:argininosuccinate lyase
MSKTLWDKGKENENELAAKVRIFTAGEDSILDLKLAEFDVLGSLAHSEMLAEVGLLSQDEWQQIRVGLQFILQEIRDGKFRIESDVEDIHSQVELVLTERIGVAGKKIHTGRSRNDQVLVDLKLFMRAEVQQLVKKVETLFDRLQTLSERHKTDLLPGYTHFQLAMPSSFGLWFGAYAEALCDDLEVLAGAYQVINKNPLGSGAGFGSPFPLDRELTTELLDFASLNYNSVYAQMSRGKTEKILAMAMSNIAATLAKMAYDVCLYTNQNFGFISFPNAITTGSSIMPHKQNPDVFELIRARCNRIQALPNELTLINTNLPSGYHRDFQETKEVLFPALENLKNCLDMSEFMLRHILVRRNILDDERYASLYSVEAVNRLVLQGESFREAYRIVGNEPHRYLKLAQEELKHTHVGSICKLATEKIKSEFQKVLAKFEAAD